MNGTGCESDETLERWSFEIEKSEELKKGKTKVEADIKEIQKGIKDVVKQIVSTGKNIKSRLKFC